MAECKATVLKADSDRGDGPPSDKEDKIISCPFPADTAGVFGRPGSQLDEKVEFKSKDGKSIWAYPVLVDFRRLLQLGQVCESSGVIPGVSIFICVMCFILRGNAHFFQYCLVGTQKKQEYSISQWACLYSL